MQSNGRGFQGTVKSPETPEINNKSRGTPQFLFKICKLNLFSGYPAKFIRIKDNTSLFGWTKWIVSLLHTLLKRKCFYILFSLWNNQVILMIFCYLCGYIPHIIHARAICQVSQNLSLWGISFRGWQISEGFAAIHLAYRTKNYHVFIVLRCKLTSETEKKKKI